MAAKPITGHGTGGLVWAHLDEGTLQLLDGTPEPAEKVKILAGTLNVKHYDDNPRSQIMIDFCMYNLVFCDENAFSLAKKSAFFSIMHHVFEHAFRGDAVDRDESLAFFKKQALQHTVEAPEDGRSGVFTLFEAKAVVSFIGKTFYRNFSAYRLCFTTKQPVENTTRYLQVQTPLTPLPLDEGEFAEE